MYRKISISLLVIFTGLAGYYLGVSVGEKNRFKNLTIYTVNAGSIVNKAIDDAIENKEEDIFKGQNADKLLDECKKRIALQKNNAKIILTQDKIDGIEDITLKFYQCMKSLSEINSR